MTLRAPKREDQPAYRDSEHMVLGHWEPTKWFRVLDHNGALRLETSNEAQAREEAQYPGRSLERRWQFVPAIHQYRRLAP